MMKTVHLIVLGVAGFLVLTGGMAAAKTGSQGEWQYGLTIYGWFPGIDGTLAYEVPPGSGSEVDIDISDILGDLQGTFMGTFEARRNRWSIFTDVIYLGLGEDANTTISVGPGAGVPVDAAVDKELDAWVVTGAVGYSLVQSEQARLDVIGGLRYLSLDTDAELSINGPLPPTPPPAKLSESVTLWDGILGVRGEIRLHDRWYLPYYADVGAGDSDLTWQALGGIGYRFDWGDLKLAYRHLSYDQGSNKFIQDVEFSGPALGVGFRF